jgi:hypothetical protein
MRDASHRASKPAPPVGGAWTPEEAGRYAAARDFELVQQMLTLSRRQLAKARHSGIWPKGLHNDLDMSTGPAVAGPMETAAVPVGTAARESSGSAPERHAADQPQEQPRNNKKKRKKSEARRLKVQAAFERKKKEQRNAAEQAAVAASAAGAAEQAAVAANDAACDSRAASSSSVDANASMRLPGKRTAEASPLQSPKPAPTSRSKSKARLLPPSIVNGGS